jgi:hypothetical protein
MLVVDIDQKTGLFALTQVRRWQTGAVAIVGMDTYVRACCFGAKSIALIEGNPPNPILAIVDAGIENCSFDSVIGGCV